MKTNVKKILALVLSLAMVLGLLAGCGAAKETPAAQQTDSAADPMDTSEYVELHMYLVGDKPDGFDAVYEKVNEILKEKLNCTVKTDWLSWSEHETKYSLLFSSGEKFDLIYAASGWCHYEQTVALGGYRPLEEEFIKTYAPDIYEMLPESAWTQAKIDGVPYMVPANFVEVTPDVVALRGDWMQKLGYQDITDFDQLVSFFRDCAEAGQYGDALGAQGLYWLWFQKNGNYTVTGAPSLGELVLFNCIDPSNLELQYVPETEEFREFCHLSKELADAGCWPSDVLSSVQERQDGLMTGRGASLSWNTDTCRLYANQANAEHPDWNINIYNVNDTGAYRATKYTNSGMCINVASQHPERAMMVINEFATNQDLQDLTQLGVEGVNWIDTGDGEYKLVEGNAYNSSNWWGWRNGALMRAEHKENPTAVDLRKAELDAYFLDHVKPDHPLDSFGFDPTNVSTQFAAVEAAMGTYYRPLINGLVDDVDASLEQFQAAMESAGIRDVLDEMQRQADAFLAEQQ